MKEIKLWEKHINLDIGEELTVKELRKVYPLVEKYRDNDIELVVQVVIALSSEENAEDIINSLNKEEFALLSEQISVLLDTKKK